MADDARAHLIASPPADSPADSPSDSPDALARELLARLSPDEKLSMLHQATPAVERLGLAPFRTGTEALHGVAWLGTATVFPQPVGLAATWDPALLRRVGEIVATEVRAKHAADPTVSLNVWAPVVNTLRHPLWGRSEEGYSEDPDLTGALASGYCKGLRGGHPRVWRTVPTLKHFLAYGNETDRAVTSSHLPPQALREYELPAHLGPVAAGDVGAVMPSYNLVNGRPNHVAGELLAELRAAAPAPIAVVSDAAAPTNLVESERFYPDHVASHAASLRAGVDSFTDNDTDAAPTLERLRRALDAGLITQDDVDAAVLRLLILRARTGELDPTSDPYAGASPDDLDLPEHRALAREAVAASVVLLENDGTLPLREPTTVAVVGPFADHVVHDWYSGTPPYRTGLATALRSRFPHADVRVADGSDRIALRSTTTGRYVVVDAGGQTLTADGSADDLAAHLDVTDWGEGVLTLRSVATGGLLTGASWILAADAERVGGWVAQESFRLHRHEDGSVSLQHVGSRSWVRVQDGGGLVVAAERLGDAERFVLRTVASGHLEVADACRGADVVLVTAGNDPHLLGRETEDRPRLELPLAQQELWEVAVESGTPAVLTMVSSYPYAVASLLPDAAAALWTSHGGQELGPGLVDVLAGDVEPSGRLAQTWWADVTDAGDLFDYDVVGARTTYRYCEAEPLWPLGHGRSYTQVEYTGLALSTAQATRPDATTQHGAARWVDPSCQTENRAGDVVATVGVRNTGARSVRELVAVYVHAPELAVPAPRVRLAAWTHVDLAPGQEARVELPVDLGHLAVWDVAADAPERLPATPGAFVVQPGRYSVSSGRSATDSAVAATLVVTGPPLPASDRRDVDAHGFHAAAGVVTTAFEPSYGSAIERAPGVLTSWARYDRLAPGTVDAVLLTIARTRTPSRTSGRLVLHARTDGGSWEHAATIDVTPDAPTAWFSAAAPATLPAGTIDVRVRLEGPVRLARMTFEQGGTACTAAPPELVSAGTEPVVSGYHPDPSICWTGDEYLLVHSSFELSPGVPLWRSADLTTWEQIGNVLERADQLPAGVASTNGGVYAPTLRSHGGRLWMITTNVSSPTPGQIVVSAPGPEGPWSAATTIEGLAGIDPDLAWDSDGTCYVTFCSSDPALPGVAQARVDLEHGVALEAPRPLWSGTGSSNPEAPHLYEHDGWWYLVIAEGGTERGHGVSVARSRHPEGPFEGAPTNPVLTRRSTTHAVQNTGHADLVRTPAGEWAMVYLGVRPRGATPHFHTNGRETFLAGIDWVDGWPQVDTERFSFPRPDHGFVDRFDTPALHPRWVSPGRHPDAFVAADPAGGVALVPDDGAAACLSTLSTRPRDLFWSAEADVLAAEHARLGLRHDDRHRFEVGVDEGRALWSAQVGDVGSSDVEVDRLVGEVVTLVVRAEPAHPHAGPDEVVLAVRDDAGERVLARLDGRYLSTEVAGGFVGRIVGVRSAQGTSRVRELRYPPREQ